jgi:hypothetical protein
MIWLISHLLQTVIYLAAAACDITELLLLVHLFAWRWPQGWLTELDKAGNCLINPVLRFTTGVGRLFSPRTLSEPGKVLIATMILWTVRITLLHGGTALFVLPV